MPTRETPEATSGQAVWTLVDALLADGQSHSGPLKDKDRVASAPAQVRARRRLPSIRLAPIALAALAVAAFLAFSSTGFRNGGSGTAEPSVSALPEGPATVVSVPPKHKKRAMHTKANVETVAYTAPTGPKAATGGSTAPKHKGSKPPKAPADKPPAAPAPDPATTDPIAGLPIELPQLPIDLGPLGLGG